MLCGHLDTYPDVMRSLLTNNQPANYDLLKEILDYTKSLAQNLDYQPSMKYIANSDLPTDEMVFITDNPDKNICPAEYMICTNEFPVNHKCILIVSDTHLMVTKYMPELNPTGSIYRIRAFLEA